MCGGASSAAERAQAMSQQTRPPTSRRKWLLVPAIAAALAGAYALAGFLLVPWLAERELPRFAEEQLQHRAKVGEIRFNPFTLKLHVREFALETREGKPVLGFAEAVADLEWGSLSRRAWMLDEVRLVDPVAHVEISKQGRLNLADLFPGSGGESAAATGGAAAAATGSAPGSATGSAKAAPAGAAPVTPEATARFAIGHFAVVNGSVAFEDHRQGYRNRAERLSIELSSLSTLGPETGPYALTAQTPGGAKLQWKGEVSLAPLAASGTLAIEGAALPELMPYVDDFTAARVVSGRADLELPYRLALVDGKPQFSLKAATLRLREFALAGSGEQALLTKFGAITLSGVDFDWGKQQILMKALRIGESSLGLGKNKSPLARIGAVNLDGARFALDTGLGSAQEIGVAGVTIAQSAEGKPLAQLGEVAFEGVEFDSKVRRASVKRLRVPEMALALQRDAAGEIDLMRLFAGKEAKSGEAKTAPGKGDEKKGDANRNDEKSGEWQASIASVEIGNAAARYADATAKTPLALALEGLSGSFSLHAAATAEGVRVRLDAGKFDLAKLDAIGTPATTSAVPQPALKLARLSISGARYDSGANAVEAASLKVGSFGVNAALEGDRLNLLDLVPAPGKVKSEKPLSAQAKSIELDEGSVDFNDRGRSIALALQRVALKLTDASNDGAKPLVFDLRAEVKSGGRIALRGRGVPAQGTLEAKIEASNVALAPAQTVLAQFANVKFNSGDVSLSGTLRAGGKDAKLAYSGSAGIANLALDDTAGVRLFAWKSVATDSLKLSLKPDRLDIDELRVMAPAGRFAIAKDGTSNISRAFGKSPAAAGEGKPAAPAAVPEARSVATTDSATTAVAATSEAAKADPAAADTTGPDASKGEGGKSGAAGTFAVAVRRVRVDQGALDFSDDSLSPGFVAKIYDLTGTANGLSSNREARSQFAFEGRVDEFGYARLSGAVNPFVPRNRSTFRVQLRNVDLITATPYSMRFAGYRIASGRINMDLNYRVRDSVIEGDNKITLDQLTLGARVDSPDALKLPFELAVKLLKDPDGTISLEVPVRGNLDDPQFSLAPLIWKAVGNLIGNILAAPFRALANLFGGSAGEDLGAVVFDPGRARLLPPEKEKLVRVASTLAKHPDLKLLIPAHYDSEADARAMKRADLGREVSRKAGFSAAQDEDPGQINIEDRQTRKALRTIFAERFSKTELDRLRTEAEAKSRAAGNVAPSMTTRLRNFVGGEPQLVDTREFHQTLLRRLRETQPLSPTALSELAQQRALAIEAALKAAGTDTSRITRTLAEPSADAEAKQVTVRLNLAAR